MATDPGPVRYRTTLAVATASGATALAHQLLWTRRMGDLLGATPQATTRVLAAFFLGLSLGSMLAGRLVVRVRRPWRALAAALAVVALLSLPMLTVPWWSTALWRALGPDILGGWREDVVELLLALALVVPPAIAMGTTMPLFAVAGLGGTRTLRRAGTWLYAANTAGGALGIVGAFGLTLSGVGTERLLLSAILVDAALAGVALAVDRGTEARVRDPVAAAAARAPLGPLAIAFVSGAGVLAAEALAIHLFDQVVSLATLGAASVLLAVVVPLALAAALAAWAAGRARRPLPAVAAALALASATAFATPLLFVWRSDGMRYLTLEFSASVAAFVGRALGLGLAAFGPFVLAAGLVLPLTFRWCDVGGDPYGRRWGPVLAANGIGGLVGAEVASRVLMPLLGMHLGFAVLAVVYGAAAVVTTAADVGIAGGVGAAAVLVAAAVALVPRLGALPLVRLDTWPGATPETARPIDLATGPEGTVVVTMLEGDRVIMLNNQYVLGGTGALVRQQRMALLPAVLHPDPKRVAFIGLGTGITAGAALLDPAARSVTAIELSPLVAAMSRKHFGDQSGAGDPRLTVLLADGRVAMEAERGAFDLIVGDLFMPWQVGTGRLYSVEHFRAVRDALSAGGEFCQWLPAYQLTPEQFRVIVASFREAFPAAYLFRDDRSAETPAFALVGYRDAPLDWDVVARRTAAMRASGRTRDGFVAFPALLRSLYLGVADGALPVGLPRNTLDDGWIERRAGLDQIGREWRYLDVETAATLPQYLQDFATGAP